jgi:hypothetical protein
VNEHDYEPLPGLPALLPEGETILWQGAPQWLTFARRAMRVRLVSAYFVALTLWGVIGGLSSGTNWADAGLSALRLTGLAGAAVALLLLFAWLVARTTLYTVTSQRVVIRFGIALPMTIQIPFKAIQSAGVHPWSDGAGDIALNLLPDQRIAYLVLWPHVRPWKLAHAQPMLRSVANASATAQVLGRALAASATQPVRTVHVPVSANPSPTIHIPAAA